MDHTVFDPGWWTTAVELPVLGGLAMLLWRTRQETDHRVDELEHRLEIGLGQARDALSAYKLEVAKSYATTGYLKDVEHRLTEHLVRIEAKLDGCQGCVK
ncbi:hypothetical protein CU669_01630 [Paramagnetospirillum kuznetsovii]|uniref:Uncharacterized protein n=1 Tax=Paramagnetospirillum kuznetsovii TaxID=2053833 RepID=A0A364P3E6_9PROT|nr:hypothetical protein [Paramagnetospirillum kuznetsovii]RAU23816.1 hypothetical protein CU669_01630 [Paramagnetospirillum kuznetsovii]